MVRSGGLENNRRLEFLNSSNFSSGSVATSLHTSPHPFALEAVYDHFTT
jgi:hypothetical protein